MSDISGSPPPPADDDPVSPAPKDDDMLSDNDSVLSDVDEAQFEDFDPTALELEDRAIPVDEDTVKLLQRHKRQRDTGAEGGEGAEDSEKKKKKKKGEGRMEKQRKSKKNRVADDDALSTEEVEGKRRRRKGAGEGEPRKKVVEVEDEEALNPEERRRRALDRAMDAALKNPNQRRRKNKDIDLNQSADDEIADLRARMAEAAQSDVEARSTTPPKPAMHKLKLLPEVVALLNRNGREIENAIVDPDNNLLESVRFFLEPLKDGSLPAYDIQRELFSALARLPIDKEALISSGLGKVVVFYTKAKKAEVPIKRAAERLLAEWTRPILKRSDDYRMRQLETRQFDPRDLAMRAARGTAGLSQGSDAMSKEEAAELRRRRELAPPTKSNRARLEATAKSYTIVPQSNVVLQQTQYARPMGASGDEAFRRMKARQLAAQGKGPRRG